MAACKSVKRHPNVMLICSIHIHATNIRIVWHHSQGGGENRSRWWCLGYRLFTCLERYPDTWQTDTWPTDIWPTDTWPTDIWPISAWGGTFVHITLDKNVMIYSSSDRQVTHRSEFELFILSVPKWHGAVPHMCPVTCAVVVHILSLLWLIQGEHG